MITLFVAYSLAATILPAAQAQENFISSGEIGGGPGLAQFDATEQNQHPNATHSVPFMLAQNEGWTWRVNVTDIRLPNATFFGDRSLGPDPRVVNTVFDFQWPNTSATLNQTLETLPISNTLDTYVGGLPLCLTYWSTPVWPNVTNKITPDNNNGSCTPAFGEECVAAIMDGHRHGRGGFCGSPAVVSDLPECQSVFSGLEKHEGIIAITMPISGNTTDNTTVSANRPPASPLRSGIGAAYSSGLSSPSPNTTAVRQAKSMLQMISLDGFGVHELLCMRVDPSIDDYEVSALANFTDEATGTSNQGSTETDSAASETSSAASVGSVVASGSVGLAGLLAFFSLL